MERGFTNVGSQELRRLRAYPIDSSEVAAPKLYQPAWPTSWSVVRQLSADSGGLGEPFGKASLANTSSGLSTLSPGKQEFLPCRTPISQSIEAWPCEALERGLDRPPKKTKKKLGRAGNRKSLKSAFQREI
jgi:hypothetical protein